MIGVIDYGAGNLLSVQNALNFLKARFKIVQAEKDFKNVDRIILPGVGAFGSAVNNLKKSGLFDVIKEWINSNKLYLGICLGLQILFQKSEESPGVEGFNVFNEDVKKFNCKKVPQIGWNKVKKKRESILFSGIQDESFFYFIHSYYVESNADSLITGETDYGVVYTSAVERGNIFAVQFHPEKSGDVGLHLIKNWICLE